MTILTNRNGEQVETRYDNWDAASKFAEIADESNWMWFFIHKLVNEAEDRPKTNFTIEFFQSMFFFAQLRGLKRPKIRVEHNDLAYQIYLSARGSVCFKVAVKYEDTDNQYGPFSYMGCLAKGTFFVNRDRRIREDEQQFINQITGDDPVGFLARCSKDMNRCCYCNKALTTKPSKAFGYGKQCAKNWGLPYNSKGEYQENSSSFAGMFTDSNFRELFEMVKSAKNDEERLEPMMILNDLLEDNGIVPLPLPELVDKVV